MDAFDQNNQVAFFRLKKLKGKNIILNAAKHNKRTITAELIKSEKINQNLSYRNESLLGDCSPEAIAHKALMLIEGSKNRNLRKDAVRGIECLFSLPKTHSINESDFFESCTNWVSKEIGGELLSVDIHRDESSPHCHILLLPLVDGKMNGSRLVGDKRRLVALQESFYANVAISYGFQKPPKKIYGLAKTNVAQAVISHLVNITDPATNSVIWQSIKDAIFTSPMNFALDTGIQLHKTINKPQKTMAQIFTSTGKGSKFQSTEHIGFEKENEENICSVGFQNPTPIESTQTSTSFKAQEDELGSSKVEREYLKPSENFNSVTGEFEDIDRPTTGVLRIATDRLVLNALEKVQLGQLKRTNQELKIL